MGSHRVGALTGEVCGETNVKFQGDPQSRESNCQSDGDKTLTRNGGRVGQRINSNI